MMRSQVWLSRVLAIGAAAGASSCTVVAVQSQDNPVGLRADGLVDGHAVVGWRDERKVLRAELFDGSSPGAIAELALWKLARIEIGLAGLSLGLGPFDVGLGAIWYDPIVPVAADSPKKSSGSNSKAPVSESSGEAQPTPPADATGGAASSDSSGSRAN